MRVLVAGASGQLGADVVSELERRKIDVIGTNSKQMNITDEEAVRGFIQKVRPDAVINCAGYTAVDAAEENMEECRLINVTGVGNLAKACKEMNIGIMHVSTDYVFDGSGTAPKETEDICNPISVYGKSKYDGELAVRRYTDKYFIVRISWLFGRHGGNFVKTMLELSKKYDRINVVSDQMGSPTYAEDVSKLMSDMIVTEKYGVYHASNEGFCSWYGFAEEIFRQSGRSIEICPVTTAQYGARAARPLNSRMSKKSLDENGFNRLPPWQDALSRYLKTFE